MYSGRGLRKVTSVLPAYREKTKYCPHDKILVANYVFMYGKINAMA
jgi:hypothetical protein